MKVVRPSEAAKPSPINLQILTPDETKPDFYESAIKPQSAQGQNSRIIARAFSIQFKTSSLPKM